MKCSKCGKKVRSSEKFCTYCGNYVGETNDTTSWQVGADLLEEEHINTQDDYEREIEREEESKEDQFQKIELSEEDALRINPPIPEPEKKEEKKEKHHAVRKESKLQESLLKDQDLNDKDFEPDKIAIKDSSGTRKTEYSYENEDLLEAYIGEDYKIIKKMPFNFWAFLLNWMYLLYRKLYLSGIIGLAITWVAVKFFRPYILYYIGGVMILLGFAFNKYYIAVSKGKVEKIIEKSGEEDRYVLANLCKEKGGVNVLYALLIYIVFLVIIFFTFITIIIRKTHNAEFVEENSINQATCKSLVKTAYTNVEEEKKVGKVSDATCKVVKNKEKEFEIVIKTEKEGKLYYSFYATENGYIKFKNNTLELADLQIKKTNGYISEEENKKLTELKLIEMNYQETFNKANEEDKLIDAKKDKEAKANFIVTEEEIIQ